MQYEMPHLTCHAIRFLAEDKTDTIVKCSTINKYSADYTNITLGDSIASNDSWSGKSGR